MTIIIDDREARMHPFVLHELKASGIPITIERMDFADYSFSAHPDLVQSDTVPTVGIEMSSVSDVCGKIDSGRLAFQLSGMMERYDVVVLLIEQYPRVDVNGKILVPGSPSQPSYHRLAAILNAAMSHGVSVQYGAGSNTIHEYIVAQYRYWQRDPESHKLFRPQNVMPQLKVSMGPALDRRIQNLMTIPGIGEDKAQRLLTKYRSLANIYQLPVSALKRMDGIGALTAQGIVDFIDNEIPDTTPLVSVEDLTEQLEGALSNAK